MRFIYVGLDTKHGARTKHEPAEEEKTVSAFIFEKTGINKMKENK